MDAATRIREAQILAKSVLLQEIVEACGHDAIERWKTAKTIEEREASWFSYQAVTALQTQIYASITILSKSETITK